LQTGTTEDDPIEGWKPITHLDLQLPNVLLDVSQPPLTGERPTGPLAGAEDSHQDATTPEPDGVDQYPVVPILTDFGLSFYSPDSGGCPLSDNPEDYILLTVDPRYPPVSVQAEPQLRLLTNAGTTTKRVTLRHNVG
jgi:hypothetical protein